jgi:hypothetical protein
MLNISCGRVRRADVSVFDLVIPRGKMVVSQELIDAADDLDAPLDMKVRGRDSRSWPGLGLVGYIGHSCRVLGLLIGSISHTLP